MTYFIGLLQKNRGTYFVEFPDATDCEPKKSPTAEQAIIEATKALAFHIGELKAAGERSPKPRSLDELEHDPEFLEAAKEGMLVFIPVVTPARKIERINITIDSNVLQAVDDAAKRKGMSRSEFLSFSAQEVIRKEPSMTMLGEMAETGIAPGTVVKIKTNELKVGRNALGIILRHSLRSQTIEMLTDAGVSLVARHEVSVPKQPLDTFIPMRLYIPYGMWTEDDGSRILFSRDYLPLWRISPNGEVTKEDPWKWIKFAEQTWFWDIYAPWSNVEKRAELLTMMKNFGIKGMPKLVDAMEILLQRKAETIKDAVKVMMPPGLTPHHRL